MFERDWDNLLILDACRYDIFEEVNSFRGDLETHCSLGSSSREFVRANFADRTLHDVVVVSANGWYKKISDTSGKINVDVHDLIVVDNKSVESHKSDIDTVRPDREWILPEAVTNEACDAIERYPNKRIIVHYHQPHTPYIGPTGKEYAGELPQKFDGKEELRTSHEILRRAYRENLEIVLEEVGGLYPELTGKTVISADHGDLLGERGFPIPVREYGHPSQAYREELVRVPWFNLPFDERKEIIAESPSDNRKNDLSIDEVNERLKKLGYKI
ncbi:hypothetical protein [Halomicrobium mukohataei]|uniref:hypothetical protein n=1 Tax=Halomicrobium mukohataei TaxID=57705 RepID=UPI0013DFE993|nr:hypothetical protein [Halomicrobium mukohataei]